jgi:pimeloyl-ACP methyl ester carboxylesterase
VKEKENEIQVPFRGFRGKTKAKGKRKWPLIILIILALLEIIWLLGPKPERPDFSKLHLSPFNPDMHILEDSINKSEASLLLKPDNQARIVWEKPYTKTPYSIVYLHGNGASQEEGDPIHEAIAHRYGCNLFLSRLADHGLQGDDPMLHINPVDWIQSALDAIEIGKAIGEKVIVVSCSTGSTLDLYLASRYPDLVESHIMMSPNVDMYDQRSFLLGGHWGLQIARKILGSDYYDWHAPDRAQQYWYTHYRIEGLTCLKTMINATMNKTTFSKIDDPMLILYYYMDEDQQDKEVSVVRMNEMFDELGTLPTLKKEVALPDAGTHIIGSSIFNSHIESVWAPITSFLENVMHLEVINNSNWKPFLDH